MDPNGQKGYKCFCNWLELWIGQLFRIIHRINTFIKCVFLIFYKILKSEDKELNEYFRTLNFWALHFYYNFSVNSTPHPSLQHQTILPIYLVTRSSDWGIATSILAVSLGVGFIIGSGHFTNLFFSSSTQEENTTDLFKPYWQAWDIIHNQYLNQPVDDTELMRGSIRGLMDSLNDPYSGYMDPDEYEIMVIARRR